VRSKALLLSLVIAFAGVFAAIPAASAPAATAPCGRTAVPPTYKHVIWIWMENHSYDSIIGSPQAPYENGLAAACGLATNDHNITHPSLPNYIGATSGLPFSELTPFVTDCNPSAPCRTAVASVFSQAPSWKAYEESMPSNCDRHDSGNYAVRHNPPPYFTTLTGCSTNDVPYTALAGDLNDGNLPAFSFVTPNLVHDTHNARVGVGDRWLKVHLPKIFASAAYKAGTTVVVLTWDEGEGGRSLHCTANTSDIGCHIATIVISPSTVPGTRSHTLFSHYSLLRTTEELLRLPLLGRAAAAKSMVSDFNL
jgi:hypothetical protein